MISNYRAVSLHPRCLCLRLHLHSLRPQALQCMGAPSLAHLDGHFLARPVQPRRQPRVHLGRSDM